MDRTIAEQALALAARKGAGGAEVYMRSGAASTIEVRDRKVDAFERAREVGAGLRVFIGGRMGFAFSTGLTGGVIGDLVDNAIASARLAQPDPFLSLPARVPAYRDVAIYDPAIEAIPEKEKIERVLAMERAAFAVDPRVRRIRKASATFSAGETLLLNSSGAEVQYRGSAVSASIEVVAEDKDESQAGWDYAVKRDYRSIDIEGVGRRAARKAVDLLGACRIDSVKAPVILEASIAQEFLDIVKSGFSAESVQKKRSLFAGKLGTAVASPIVTVLDDGLLAGGLGSAPADDEGVPMSCKTVIEEGRLVQFLHSAYTAKKDGTVSTGNAVRAGFRSAPGVGVTNLYIRPGMTSPDDLLASTSRGLYVTEIMGAHTANPISGDFSVGATGFWVENGRKVHPVREATIAGNIIDVMKDIDAVCSDLQFSGRIGSPTIRIRELSIGGK